MFLSLDGTFWVQVISFGIFLVLLNQVFLEPVGAAIKRRRAHIDGVRSDLERYEREAAQMRDDASRRRGAARRASDERVHVARQEAEQHAASLTNDATTRAHLATAEAHAVVATELVAARAESDVQARELSRLLLARATGSGPETPDAPQRGRA